MVLEAQRQAFAIHLFLSEIAFQSELAARAAERLVTSTDQVDSVDIWSAIQSILVAAGNVSKILWPARRRYDPRGTMLRELLGVDEDSALSDRKLRNHFEHYDERLEDWLSSNHSVVYVDQIIGSLSGYLRDFPQNAHRNYDPATQILAFRGEAISLRSLLESLKEIGQKCRLITRGSIRDGL
jgi:hypothetical protein